MEAEELQKRIKPFLVGNTTDIRTNLSEAEVKELSQYLTEAWDKAGRQLNKKFIIMAGNRSYECFIKDLKNYKDFVFF